MADETYLGDGLYASHDGNMYILRAPRLAGDHWIGLEPAVLDAFIKFVETTRERVALEREAEKHG